MSGRLPITGDEPHYLIIAASVLRDRDFDVSNNYQADATTHEIYPARLAPHALRRETGWWPQHMPGLGVLLAIPLGLGGAIGARIALATLLIPVLGMTVYRWSRAHLRPTDAMVATVGVMACTPVIFGASEIYPDLPAGVTVLALVCWLWARNGERSALGWCVYWCAAGFLTLRRRIVALAHRHRRDGAGMIYLKLRQAGHRVNHKRVERLYTEAQLQVRRRRRKKIPVAGRQPLVRPQAPNDVWSADFVFDRTADGRVVKCLTIVDDATTEAVAIVPARALGGRPVTRTLDRLALVRGLPRVLRTDNAQEFCGRAMLTWAHERGVALRLIEPGKPNQNAYIKSFNGRFRDECLTEHWFTSLAHAQAIIETWRHEYNEDRPKKGLGGLTPALYARQLVATRSTVTVGL